MFEGLTNEEILENAEIDATKDAALAISYARESGNDPVVFITGNSHMPPLRAFGNAETYYLTDSAAAFGMEEDCPCWEVYAETFEQTLEKANVYLACPEYDNALYVVDMSRFEYVCPDEGYADGGTPYTDDDFPTLSSEWRLITNEEGN